jgi:histidinol-phosphate/aromatic aminotransferase/cobyric acid decarboxylase-like protein
VVAEKLAALAFVKEVFPSDSNFLLFRVEGKAKELYKTVSDERGYCFPVRSP